MLFSFTSIRRGEPRATRHLSEKALVCGGRDLFKYNSKRAVMKLMQMRHSLFPCHFLLSLTFPQILKANYKLEGERQTQRKRPLEKLIMAEVCMD